MARPRRLRNEAARDLVLALRSRLEPSEPLANAVVDALVVAGLEVEAVEVGAAAPVAAVERRAAAEADCRSDRHTVVARKHDDQVVRHRRRDRGKELPIQVRLAAAAPKRARVELEDRFPIGRCRLAAAQVLEHDAGFSNAPALALGFLALVGAEGSQELVEAPITAVGPVELAAFS